MRFVKVVVMLLVTVFYFRSHVGSIEKMKAVKSSLAASSGAERQQAVRFKNELKAGICGSGVVKRKLTYGVCASCPVVGKVLRSNQKATPEAVTGGFLEEADGDCEQ